MKELIATGNQSGIKMNCSHKAYLLSGVEYWVRIIVGNIAGDKDFAEKELLNNKDLDIIVINNRKIKG